MHWLQTPIVNVIEPHCQACTASNYEAEVCLAQELSRAGRTLAGCLGPIRFQRSLLRTMSRPLMSW